MADDPLASPTLAQLYASQGHLEKARGVVAVLLRRDPFEGHALALRDRILSRAPTLTLRHDPDVGAARLGWSGVDIAGSPGALQAIVHTWSLVTGSSVWIRSRPVGAARGEHVFEVPAGPASATACIGALGPDRRPVILCACEPASW